MGVKGFTDKGHHIFGFLEIVRFPFRFDGDVPQLDWRDEWSIDEFA